MKKIYQARFTQYIICWFTSVLHVNNNDEKIKIIRSHFKRHPEIQSYKV